MSLLEGSFAIGPGEVGRRLGAALGAAGLCPRVVTRHEGWDAALAGADRAARIVAVREEQLGAVIERFAPALLPRLLLVQNGFLEPLVGHGAPLTRGLIWFTSKGEFLRDFGEELAALVEEACRAASAEYGVGVDAAEALRCLEDTTAEQGWVRGGTKALAFRGGAIARFGRRHGIPTPVTDRLLAAAGAAPGEDG